jgi:Putative MetA-pathway of phenol degradation
LKCSRREPIKVSIAPSLFQQREHISIALNVSVEEKPGEAAPYRLDRPRPGSSQPRFAMIEEIEIDGSFVYLFNGKNHKTNYRSGQEFSMDYAVGYSPAPSGGPASAGTPTSRRPTT